MKNLTLRGIQTSLAQPDERPALVLDDVETAELASSAFTSASEAEPCIRFVQVRDAFVHGSRAPGPTHTWLHVSGDRSQNISVIGNDLVGARKAVETTPEAAKGTVFLAANRCQ